MSINEGKINQISWKVTILGKEAFKKHLTQMAWPNWKEAYVRVL